MPFLSTFFCAVVFSILSGAYGAPPPAKPPSPGVPAKTAASMNMTSWTPPAHLKAALDATWAHDMSTRKPDMTLFKNYGYNQLLASNGTINFCVRWDSRKTATPEMRKQIEATVKRETKKWMDVLVGYEGWPFTDVPVKVVGWAARSQGLMQGWSESEGYKFHGDRDREGIPQCSPTCGRFFHQDGNYATCAGGKDMHYDMSLWLTDGMAGGAGGDWGQRLGTDMFLNAMKGENVHIFLHEMGHTFGLNDFYDYRPPGQTNFIMMAGSAMFITEFDAWMMRDWWRHLSPKLLPVYQSSQTQTKQREY